MMPRQLKPYQVGEYNSKVVRRYVPIMLDRNSDGEWGVHFFAQITDDPTTIVRSDNYKGMRQLLIEKEQQIIGELEHPFDPTPAIAVVYNDYRHELKALQGFLARSRGGQAVFVQGDPLGAFTQEHRARVITSSSDLHLSADFDEIVPTPTQPDFPAYNAGDSRATPGTIVMPYNHLVWESLTALVGALADGQRAHEAARRDTMKYVARVAARQQAVEADKWPLFHAAVAAHSEFLPHLDELLATVQSLLTTSLTWGREGEGGEE